MFLPQHMFSILVFYSNRLHGFSPIKKLRPIRDWTCWSQGSPCAAGRGTGSGGGASLQAGCWPDTCKRRRGCRSLRVHRSFREVSPRAARHPRAKVSTGERPSAAGRGLGQDSLLSHCLGGALGVTLVSETCPALPRPPKAGSPYPIASMLTLEELSLSESLFLLL